MTKAQKRERVSTVITALGLDACKDTIVGGFFRKGISGGERKRTSVGHELLINPSLLLLDEPTRWVPRSLLCAREAMMPADLNAACASKLLGRVRGMP